MPGIPRLSCVAGHPAQNLLPGILWEGSVKDLRSSLSWDAAGYKAAASVRASARVPGERHYPSTLLAWKSVARAK
jgi:hypothetical protein